MRTPLLALMFAAGLAAGCIGAPESTDPLSADHSDAPNEPQAAADEPAESADADDGTSDPTAQENSTSEHAPPPPAARPDGAAEPEAPPAPVPTPWNLTGSAALGWVAAFGDGGAAKDAEAQAGQPVPAREVGETDATRCPDALLTVPAEAKVLRLTRAGEPISPEGQSGGILVLEVVDPAGATVALQGVPSVADDFPYEVPTPAPGEWRLHVRPMGPVVGATWTIGVEVLGESLAPPTILALAPGCAPA